MDMEVQYGLKAYSLQCIDNMDKEVQYKMYEYGSRFYGGEV